MLMYTFELFDQAQLARQQVMEFMDQDPFAQGA